MLFCFALLLCLFFTITYYCKAICHHYLVAHTLLLCLSLLHLATLAIAPSCSTITACYFALLLCHHASCSRLTTLPCCLSCLVVHLFFRYLLPHPHCCFITLLLTFMPYCSTLSVGIPSPLSCVSGGAQNNNNNKFHPTT